MFPILELACQIRAQEIRDEARVRVGHSSRTDSILRTISVTSCGDHSTRDDLTNMDSVIETLTADLQSGLDLMKLKIQVTHCLKSTHHWHPECEIFVH